MKSPKVSICVFIDALGWEVLKAHRFLDDVLVTKQPVRSMLGYSATCVPTILTGQYPQRHGHLSFFFYSPKTSPFRGLRWLRYLPSGITSRGRVRNVISKLLKKIHRYTGYFQIYNMPFEFIHLFDYSEKNDIYEPGGINGGVPTIFDHMRKHGVPFHKSDWRRSEQANFEALAAELRRGGIRFAYLYWADLDCMLHAQTKTGPHIAQKLAGYEARLREILKIAEERYQNVELHIFSDHGMCTVDQTVDLMRQIDRSGLRFGEDYAAVYDSTMARFWFLKEGVRSIVEKILAQEKQGRILTDGELEGWGSRFEGQKYGELFFLMRPGALICPSHMGEDPIGGMHGYDPAHPDSMAVFASNVRPQTPPRDLTDLYGIMAGSVADPVPGVGG